MRDKLAKIDKTPVQSVISAVLPDGSLVETIFQEDINRTLFCIGKNDTWSIETDFQTEKQKLIPYSQDNNLLQHGVILLPSAIEEYDQVETLISEIQSYVHRYVDLDPLFEEIAGYYVLLTWRYDSFNELPYLRFRGDYGSGKTRALLVIGSICYKPIFASGASTVSPLFRMLDSIGGTLIIDEGDFRFSDEKSDIIKILNNGNAKGFPVLRSEASPKGEFSPHAFTVFGPKLIATRKQFYDRALESRCITEEMGKRKLRNDIALNLPESQKLEAQTLRNKLLLYRLRNYGKSLDLSSFVDSEIDPRLNQVFTPLLSLANTSTRTSLETLLSEYNDDLIADRGMSIEGQILEVIRDLIASGETQLSIKDISSWFLDRYGDDYGRKISPKWIGNVIRINLQLKTRKSHGVFVLPPSEYPKLKWLYKRFGVNELAE